MTLTLVLVAAVAALAIAVVAAGLLRHRRALRSRALRRELDSYLRWLVEDATGPLSLSGADSRR